MSSFLKYVVLVILLLVVFAIIWILRDGLTSRRSGGFSGFGRTPPPNLRIQPQIPTIGES